MPEPLDFQHGIRGILFSIAGLLAAQLASTIVKGIWTFINRHKGPTVEQFREHTKALQENTVAMKEQKLLNAKMASDIRRIYLFLKLIAGDRWPKFRKQVEEMEKDN